MKSLPLVLIFLATLIVSESHANTCPKYQVQMVAEGLGVPWSMALLDPNTLLVTERSGKLLQLDLITGKQTSIKGLPTIHAKGQGGLLDIKLGPNVSNTSSDLDQNTESNSSNQRWLYFTYSKPVDGQGRTTLARAQIDSQSQDLKLVNWQDLLVTKSATDTHRHFGSRIAFDDKGHLFFSVGDRGHRPNGQDLTTHAGSILRLNLDGSVPHDNPFVSDKNALNEIYSYGHRNPQGLAYDAKTQRLWSIEHGPRGGDEINLIKPGHNYGWPEVSFGKEYWGPISVGEGTFKEGMEPPTKVYTPSIAPSSLLVYSGLAFTEWQGNLLSGALKLTHLNRVTLSGEQATSEERLLTELNERIRQVIEDEQGYLLISTDSGNIYRMKPCDA